MTGELHLSLFKLQATALLLVKVVVLLKYFLFMKYKSPEWSVLNFLYFPARQISSGEFSNDGQVKKTQNMLTAIFVGLNLLVVVARSAM